MALEGMDLPGLRDEWRRRFGAPPRLRSADLLRRWLAWKIQVEACSGLDPETALLLRRPGARPPDRRLRVGVRLTREWKGVRREVEVIDDGFLHDGRRYRSLSEVARAITGVRWNGPRFFGLREEEQA